MDEIKECIDSGKCKYCKNVSYNHPEGLHTWTGYVCRNSKSKRCHNARSTMIGLCEGCKDHVKE